MWINTSKTPFNLEQHPFSIAGGEIGTGTLSFVIRELGDYTSSLDSLQPGQTVYVDGPYGSMSVDQGRSSAGITLIAGGAGIAPLLGLLRELAKRNETRPVRLVYGNRNLDRMVAISSFGRSPRRCGTSPCNWFATSCRAGRARARYPPGVIDESTIRAAIEPGKQSDWSVYLCGPGE